MRKNQKGFASVVFVLIFITLTGLTGVLLYAYLHKNQQRLQQESNDSTKDIVSSPSPQSGTNTNDVFITAVPIDLNQTENLSKFRSCAGHDFSGKDANFQEETNRSMKHYVGIKRSLLGTINQVSVFAPFDGKVQQIVEGQSGGVGVLVSLKPNQKTDWQFVFDHVTLLPTIRTGSTFKAGDLIAYGNLPANANSFDLELKRFVDANGNPIDIESFHPGQGETEAQRSQMFRDGGGGKFSGASQELDSVFNHMTNQVLNAFAGQGITSQNIIVDKSYRDTHPCQNFSYKNSDYVMLK